LLYLAELLQQDTALRFGYADDVALYRATESLDRNIELLARDVQAVIDWGRTNKVAFAPEKLEMIHITRRRGDYAPPLVVNDSLTIHPNIAEEGDVRQPALRWLGVWFDRKLTWRRHVAVRAAKARRVAQHIRDLARTVDGPPASSLRKAVTTCVIPAMLYGTEAWYAGRTKPARYLARGPPEVRARIGGLVELLDRTLTLAIRGVLPVWRTTPVPALFRDAGLPSAMAALEDAKLRFALRLSTVDESHPLVRRITPPLIVRGRGAGTRQRAKTKVQLLGALLPVTTRPRLVPPHYTPGCREDPTRGVDKAAAAAAFRAWQEGLAPTDTLIFSDGSEQHAEGSRRVGYGFAVYRAGRLIGTGHGAIHSTSHVFDAEAIAAWKGLDWALAHQSDPPARVWLCIDSTSVIWCIRGDASVTSQWAFLKCQEAMRHHDIQLKWAPGHMGIEGNETADSLANQGALCEPPMGGLESLPTPSGTRSVCRDLRKAACADWWDRVSVKLSAWYRQWDIEYAVKPLPELDLHRRVLHRWLALRSSHGDFKWYHRRFRHEDAKLTCSCGASKSPAHLVLCPKAQYSVRKWPGRPLPPSNKREAVEYLRSLTPGEFAELLRVTEFYSRYCTR
jgi:ribonuclease HI